MIKMDHSRDIIWDFLLLSSWIPFSYWYHETVSRHLSPAEDSDSNEELDAQGDILHTLALILAADFFPLRSGMKLFSLAFLLQVSVLPL